MVCHRSPHINLLKIKSITTMSTQTNQLTMFNALLEVHAPFTVIQRIVDMNLRHVDVWIDLQTEWARPAQPKQSSWFGFKKAESTPAPAPVPTTKKNLTEFTKLHHLKFGNWKVWVHIPPIQPSMMSSMPWAGSQDSPFTNGMADQIFDMLSEGATLSVICTSLGIDLSNLMKYKLALEKGLVGSSPRRAAMFEKAVFTAQSINFAHNEAGNNAKTSAVPSIEDMIWIDIANGIYELQISTLSLRLLITKIKTQYRLALDDGVRAMYVRELHRYFEKNQRNLSQELAQIKNARLI
jgi:hypothetical protein